MNGPGRMHGAVGELLAGRDRVSDECARLLKQLQTRCPGVLPDKPLEPGAVGPEIPLSRDELQKLASVAAVTAAGLPTGTDAGQVVWSQGGNELLVMLAKVAVHVDHGIALVDIPVSCDQAAEGHVTVAFAVGDDRRPAGMLAVTEDRPSVSASYGTIGVEPRSSITPKLDSPWRTVGASRRCEPLRDGRRPRAPACDRPRRSRSSPHQGRSRPRAGRPRS